MIRIEPREMPSKLWTIGIPIISALIAILFAAIPLALAGANIFEAYSQMAKGIFGLLLSFDSSCLLFMFSRRLMIS